MSETKMTKEQAEKWYDENIKLYSSLAENVANTLKTALDKMNISYVDVPYRAKAKESFLKKWNNKKYKDISSMTDISGIRVITLVESDLDEVEELIRKLFKVHDQDSIDKSVDLGENKLGYRSRHFVCDIGSKREKLIELEHFKQLKFEIQIRTALAHAWAEIEHDRGYKLEGGLPIHIKRRLNLVAGWLESADNEFNRLTAEIDNYKKEVNEQVTSDKLDIEITSISLYEYLHKNYKEIVGNKEDNLDDFYIEILYKLDINNLDKLNNLMKKYQYIIEAKDNFEGMDSLINTVLIIEYKDKYLCFLKEIRKMYMDNDAYNLLSEFLEKDVLNSMIKKYNIEIGD